MTIAQSIAARRKARRDKRYTSQKSKDAQRRHERYRAKVVAEQERKQRASKKKKK